MLLCYKVHWVCYSYIAFSLEHITWEVTTLSLKHLLTYPHTQDMGRSHLSMPGYGDPITTRGSHACILQEQKKTRTVRNHLY